MLHKDFHPSDQELLLAADGELVPNTSAHTHLAGCGRCRARMKEIESTIANVVLVHREPLDSQLPPIEGRRALLTARLAELADTSHVSQWQRLGRFVPMYRRSIYLCAGIAAVVLMAVGFVHQLHLYQSRQSQALRALGSMPSPVLTPGDVRPMANSEICAAWPEKLPTIPSSVQRIVLAGYSIASHRPDAYELDFLITPELGGAPSVRNLWPEPYHNTVWNAHVKDQLENYLHQSVCRGDVDLATTQREIATDWIAAYRNYFHTDRPLSNLPDIANVVLDRMPSGTDSPVSFGFQAILRPVSRFSNRPE